MLLESFTTAPSRFSYQFIHNCAETWMMCYKEHVFHTPCHHWGREQFVGEPCCRSRVVQGEHTGCAYVEVLGSSNSELKCQNCMYRTEHPAGWKPFANISNEAWAKVEEKSRKRTSAREDRLQDRTSKPFPLRGKVYKTDNSCV
jgi:hypothetical protein